ncbi:lipo-like protein [Acidocella sp. KAb 2-4]|uniref:lipo-like protein n=1 Tax=Acidocella sp. KAb 2-4 TaxID=2885158 RepID=UPI001D06301C|nr:lipo-like protein [Acidocella sp. KAb 2-4]MCB5945424.1 lipo-like protein [Acidocella sp. KAb 2-4]
MNRLRRVIGELLARFLTTPVQVEPALPVDITALCRMLRKADVILVEGDLRISSVIKYLTQSTWSHAVLYAGDGECIEADVIQGVRRFKLEELARYHLRICRALDLTDEEAEKVVAHAESRLGVQYDLKHVFDLARYMVPLPLPRAWRRRAIALGSADPSRAICSTLVAESFQAIRYPILPDIETASPDPAVARKAREIYHIHDTGLFTPRDFDLSPFFQVIKPEIPRGFDHHRLVWAD